MLVAIPEWIHADFSAKTLSANGDFVAVFSPAPSFMNLIQKFVRNINVSMHVHHARVYAVNKNVKVTTDSILEAYYNYYYFF